MSPATHQAAMALSLIMGVPCSSFARRHSHTQWRHLQVLHLVVGTMFLEHWKTMKSMSNQSSTHQDMFDCKKSAECFCEETWNNNLSQDSFEETSFLFGNLPQKGPHSTRPELRPSLAQARILESENLEIWNPKNQNKNSKIRSMSPKC